MPADQKMDRAMAERKWSPLVSMVESGRPPLVYVEH